MTKRASRRTFLKLSAAAASVAAAKLAHAAPPAKRIAIVTDREYPPANSEPVLWATARLRDAITLDRIATGPTGADLAIVIHSAVYPLGKMLPSRLTFTHPEALSLIPSEYQGTPAILVSGSDTRGLVYGILELADRVRASD